MDHSPAQNQEMMNTNSLECMLMCNTPKSQQVQDPNSTRKPRPAPEQALKCPRCDSSNTKFCYYNNYSLTQPRYFCKSCRRYWTKGGTLRNVPVGGGCRKNKRSSSSGSTPSSKKSSPLINPNPLITTVAAATTANSYDSNDLTLAFSRLQKSCTGSSLIFDHHDLVGPGGISSFLQTQSNFIRQNQNSMYTNYGFDDHDGLGRIEMGLEQYDPDHDQLSNATTQAVTVTTMKQEVVGVNSNNNNNNESKILWGFPWQMSDNNGGNGDININNTNSNNNNYSYGIGDHIVDLNNSAGGRSERWISGMNSSSSWHGLLNSPLM